MPSHGAEGEQRSGSLKQQHDAPGFLMQGTSPQNRGSIDETREIVKFDHLSLDQGLSQGTVNRILRDSLGFMWFATNNGLNKYDGYRFYYYSHHPDDPDGLTNNKIYTLYEEPPGMLWIGTAGGLNRLNMKTERYTHFRADSSDTHSLSDDAVLSAYRDRVGRLWFGTANGGLNRWEPDTENFTVYRHTPDNPGGLSHNTVSSICENTGGGLWIGTLGGGLNRFDPVKESFRVYRHQPGKPGSLSHDSISSLYEDSTGILWIGTMGGGLCRFDDGTRSFRSYRHDRNDPYSLSADSIISIYEDSAGKLWIGTAGGGLNRWDRETGRFTRYRREPGNQHSLSDDVVMTIYEAPAGTLWVGTVGGGVNFFDREREKFALYKPSLHALSSANITAICEDGSGELWLGTFGGGLNRFNRKTGKSKVYRHHPGTPGGIGSDAVSDIYEDLSGNLWIGTFDSGLNKFDKEKEVFSIFRQQRGNSRGINSDTVTCIYPGAPGILWLGTGRNGGLSRFNTRTGTAETFIHNPGEPSSLSHNYITSICRDSFGNFWVGTEGGGLNLMDAGQGTFKAFKHIPGDPGSISYNTVGPIYEDRNKTLWIGTHGGGLNRFDRVTGNFFHVTTRDGLPDNVINGILEDEAGNLWLSSNRGISRYTPSSGLVKGYDPRSGLQGYEFNGRAYYKSPGGEFFFGGTHGLNAFYPERLKDNPFIPPVVLTEFKISNRPVGIGGESPLKSYIGFSDEIVLSHREHTFSFEFASLCYANPARNQYRYMMEGVHNEWISLGHKHDISFSGMNSGRYVLKVMGSNNDGVWNPQPTEITIVITPPFWKSWWFRAGLVLILGLMIYLWHRSRMKHLFLRLKSESEMERLFGKYNVSARERDVIDLILKGKSNKEIEEALFISIKTVKSHVYSVFRKFGVKNRLELIHLIQKATRVNSSIPLPKK